MNEQERVLRFLRNRQNYPHPTDSFEVHQTHISWVFLAGPFAYKLKKAASFGFLDYSTLELRRIYCEEELRLNRRLAPEVYCDLMAVVERDGQLVFNSKSGGEKSGCEVDYLVRMKRLSKECMFDSLIQSRMANREHIRQLVGRLVPFYEQSERFTEPQGYGSPSLIREMILENFEQTKEAVGDLLNPGRFHAIRSGQLSYLTLREDLFRKRLVDGWIRDGHGDLRAEHVGFSPGCIIVDCIEFNDTFRRMDVAADLAFLRMDLDFLGAPQLGHLLIRQYRDASGDQTVDDVLDFYMSYRAYVRGKVDGMKLRQSKVSDKERDRLTKRARRYFELAYFYTLSFHHPLLLTVGGLSGTGKSATAQLLSQKIGAVVLRSDKVRKELFDVPEATERSPASYGDGIYSEQSSRATYAELSKQSLELLREGSMVIVDAAFPRRRDRTLFSAIAHETGVRHVHFECQVPKHVAAKRMQQREAAGNDLSEATVEIQAAQRRDYEPCVSGEAVSLNTLPPPEEVVEAIINRLPGSAGVPPAS